MLKDSIIEWYSLYLLMFASYTMFALFTEYFKQNLFTESKHFI